MARTTISTSSAQAVKRWAAKLAIDSAKKSYWTRKFIGTDDESVIHRITSLEDAEGDKVVFDLAVALREAPTTGDNLAEGTEEELRFFQDEVVIDQMRHPVSAGGRMTRKRTIHNLRTIAKNRLSDYWARYWDEMIFVYLSGSRGHNTNFIQPTSWTGHAGNAIQAPDSSHIIYAGSATAFGNITVGDTMTKTVVERAAVKASMLQEMDSNVAHMNPVNIAGNDRYVLVMSEFQAYDLRVSDTTGWIQIQQAAAAAEGRDNPIFQGGLGLINDVVLQKHAKVIRFTNGGVGANIAVARALLLGRQAGIVAYGTPGGLRFSWQEDTKDYGNLLNVNAGTIVGVKKTRFNGLDFGVIAVDTAAKNPNP